MDRNEKVEFTMEGYQKVLESLNIQNICVGVPDEKAEELKAALLAEVAINFLM